MRELSEIRSLLDELELQPASQVESQDLDFKEWDTRIVDKAVRSVVQVAICMANGGGTVVLGVEDKAIGRAKAILGVPPEVDVNRLKKAVYDCTDPKLTPVFQELAVPEGTGRIIVMQVYQGLPSYTDTSGQGTIRIGKECKPLTGTLRRKIMVETGEARYGDWIEKLLYNGIGAALPIVTGGKHFYYANYHLGAAMKTYSRNMFTCCSGTYFQNITEYQNLVYFRDNGGLYVNLYLPSEVEWKAGAAMIKIVQTTDYPEAQTSSLKFSMDKPQPFDLKLRVPSWSQGMRIDVNGAAQSIAAKSGMWATITRTWQTGDKVDITIPLYFRRAPIDRQHLHRVALVRGPVVYAQEVVHKALSVIPESDEELDKLMKPLDKDPALFLIGNEEPVQQRDAFMPYYRYPEVTNYRMYHDSEMRRTLW